MSDRAARVIAYAIAFASGAVMYSTGTVAGGMERVTAAANLANTGIWCLALGALALAADCLWPVAKRRLGRAGCASAPAELPPR